MMQNAIALTLCMPDTFSIDSVHGQIALRILVHLIPKW